MSKDFDCRFICFWFSLYIFEMLYVFLIDWLIDWLLFHVKLVLFWFYSWLVQVCKNVVLELTDVYITTIDRS
jgi:hypothetical protein